MTISIQASTTTYEEDSIHVKKAIANMASLCGYPSGYDIGKPSIKFGWTFYTIHLENELFLGIKSKFGDMLKKGRNDDEGFIYFMTKYLEARNIKVKLKLLPD